MFEQNKIVFYGENIGIERKDGYYQFIAIIFETHFFNFQAQKYQAFCGRTFFGMASCMLERSSEHARARSIPKQNTS